MINNLPVKTLKHGDLTIEGYSRAAVQTYWRFPVIYMPAETIEPMQKILRQFTKLDRGRLPCEMKPIAAGDEIELSRELVVSAVATRHTVPSLGFVVWDRRRKLKPEYQDLTGEQIRDIRLSGQEVSAEVRKPILAYMGDSAPGGLDDNPVMYEAKVLICELTFVAPDHRRDKIHKFGHMHLNDIVERRHRFKNELVIAAHLSTRYHSKTVREIVSRAIPDMLDGRMHLWL
jgi:ribonuclease Z